MPYPGNPYNRKKQAGPTPSNFAYDTEFNRTMGLSNRQQSMDNYLGHGYLGNVNFEDGNSNPLGKQFSPNAGMEQPFGQKGGFGGFNPKNPDGLPEYTNPASPGEKKFYDDAVLGNGRTMDDAKAKFKKGLESKIDPMFGGTKPDDGMSAMSGKIFGPNSMGKFGNNGNPILGNEGDGLNLNPKMTNGPPPESKEEDIAGKAPKPSVLGLLPAVASAGSLINGLANGPESTTLDRVDFENVDYNPIIAANNASIQRGTNTTNTNIRQNARTFGQLSGGQSANNIRGAQAQGENTAKLGAMERNVNSQISNQESQINTGIANQEQDINDQNQAAHRNQLFGDAINIGTSIAGFGSDTATMAADFTQNQNFLGSMEYLSPMFRAMYKNYSGKDLDMKTKYETK
jgi:hypothetical protein